MPVHPIRSHWVKVPNGALQIDAYLAQPVAEGRFPGVVVIQEIFGVNAHIREVTEKIAQHGYVAIAPAIYQRLAPGFEAGYSPEDIALGRQYKEQTKAEELLSDIGAAIAYLKSLPAVKTGGVGCIGFCFGGHVAYLAATLPEVAATASFYGAGIATFCPGGGPPTITRTPQIQGTLYAFYGMKDELIPLEQVDQIEAALQEHNSPHQIFRYANAGHGFCCDQRADYVPDVAADAWNHVWELFRSCL
ncbi:MAG TPA: dienelactone hydrolase family protein [Synechococcales cyanobacterium M55_K2018_004]|nr:dienelactone hydrolase family protein [Synechococcales cyanobacterium M55_K2018_004]